jgi:outer membrane protein assembly factor BamE
MSRAQVRDILGSPLLTDPFHADRWDYIFAIRRAGTDTQRRSVVVRFDGEAFKAIEAPDLPSEREFIAAIARAEDVSVPKLALTDDERKALPQPPKPEEPTTAPEPVGPVRDYPPLEPA